MPLPFGRENGASRPPRQHPRSTGWGGVGGGGTSKERRRGCGRWKWKCEARTKTLSDWKQGESEASVLPRAAPLGERRSRPRQWRLRIGDIRVTSHARHVNESLHQVVRTPKSPLGFVLENPSDEYLPTILRVRRTIFSHERAQSLLGVLLNRFDGFLQRLT